MELKELSVFYDKKLALFPLSTTIKEGCLTAIIGKNGSGKSTLLRAIASLHKKQMGSVWIDDQNIFSLSAKERAKKITLLTQNPQISQEMTVEQLVALGRYPHQKGRFLTPKDKEVIEKSLYHVNMLQYKSQLITDLSGGQRQRVWLALALAQETPFLLLDEPTTYLDLEGQLEILQLLKYLQKELNKTMIIVHHDINQVARFCDEILVMNEGKLLAQGSVKKVMTKECLKQVYHLQMDIQEDENYGCPQITFYDLLESDDEKN